MATSNLKTIFERFKTRVTTAKYVADPWVDGDLWERAVKEWGNANGYFGATGGWIYKGESQAAVSAGGGRSVCQGWDNLRHYHREEILDWYTQKLTANARFRELTTPAPGSSYRPTLLVLSPKDWRYAFLASSYDVAMAAKRDARRAYTGHSAPTEGERLATARRNSWVSSILRAGL